MATPNLMTASQMVPTVLVSTRIGVTTDSAVYTVPAAHAAQVKSASICNTSASAVTVGLSIVPSGGTIGDGTHKVIADTFSIAAGDTQPLDLIIGSMLGDGDVIACHAGTANVLDIVITGVLIS